MLNDIIVNLVGAALAGAYCAWAVNHMHPLCPPFRGWWRLYPSAMFFLLLCAFDLLRRTAP